MVLGDDWDHFRIETSETDGLEVENLTDIDEVTIREVENPFRYVTSNELETYPSTWGSHAVFYNILNNIQSVSQISCISRGIDRLRKKHNQHKQRSRKRHSHPNSPPIPLLPPFILCLSSM